MTFFDLLQQNPAVYLTSVAILGLLIGSFLNVVIYRLPVMLKQEWRSDCEEFLAAAENATPEIQKANNTQQTFNLIEPRSRCPHSFLSYY